MSVPVSLGPSPQSLAEALAGRLGSLVHIMRGRWSLLSRVGVLALERGMLTLRDGAGTVLFAVPAGTVAARRQRRRLALHQMFFQIRVGDRWWYLVAHVPTTHVGAPTRMLVEHYPVCEAAPLLPGMTVVAYARFTRTATSHQVLWSRCWLEALSRAAES